VLSEGADAPGFELPALVDGEKRRVALDEYLGDDVVILAFYPADFNPACDDESCDLDELDLFTMQKDVTILGVSPDSVYSHRAFAERYDLKVPLLSDTDGEVAERYDIDLVDDIGQRLVERAVAVVDHDGTVTYSWSTDDMTELPRVEEIKDALAETGGDDTAFARYRVGHAHYTEGRRAFTSAMESFRNTEWVMSQQDFQQAREEFEEAADRFDTALRFVDDESLAPIYEGANEKATALWQAADWLVRSASAYSSGSGTEGQELRDDAEIPLSTVREYREPPGPDAEWPPEMENLEQAESDDHSILPTEPDVEAAALEIDIDEADTDSDDQADPETGDEVDTETGDEATDAAPDAEESADPAERAADDGDGADPEPAADDDIDDDELAEIQAELAANNPESEPSVEELTEESTSIVDAPPMGASDGGADGAAAVDGVPEESTAIVDPPSMDESDPDATTQRTDAVEPVDERAGDAPDRSGDTADDVPADASGDGDGTTDDVPDGAAADSTPEMATDGSDGVAGDERGGTESEGEDDEADAVESEDDETDDGPELQLELAEPDPDPIDADGPPSTGESDGESGSDE
jgi:peroxiredoxin